MLRIGEKAERVNDRAHWLAQNVLPYESGLRAWLSRRRVVNLDIDDIVQESYAVLVELDSVSHIRNPRTYLYSVARSVILQHVRRSRIVSIDAMADLDHLSIYSEQPTPEEALSDVQELKRISQLIGRLPGKCREAFSLRKIEGLSQKEIASRMRISVNTVEKHVGKAIRLLISAVAAERSVSGAAPSQTVFLPHEADRARDE